MAVVVSDVNTTNIATHRSVVVIHGTFPAGTYTVDINGYFLTVATVTGTFITCDPVNIFDTSLKFGTFYTLTVTDTDTSTSGNVSVVILPSEDLQYQVIANLFPGGLLKGVIGVADGQQVAVSQTLAGSDLTLYADTDVLFDPAVPNGTEGIRHWHNGVTWITGPFYVNRSFPTGSKIDAKWSALRGQGFTGAIPDMTLQWLKANGATSNCTSTAWQQMLASKGFTGQRNTAWYALLGSLGYTGALSDRELQFWLNGGSLAYLA